MEKMIETTKGDFEVIENYRDMLDVHAFEERYLEEIHNKYTYFVGDYSAGILRIKGFYEGKRPNFENIPDYLHESCAVNCPYYILKRKKREY